MFNAIMKYAKSRKGLASRFLRVVTYIDIDSETIEVFQKEFEFRFKKNGGRLVTPPRDLSPPERI